MVIDPVAVFCPESFAAGYNIQEERGKKLMRQGISASSAVPFTG